MLTREEVSHILEVNRENNFNRAATARITGHSSSTVFKYCDVANHPSNPRGQKSDGRNGCAFTIEQEADILLIYLASNGIALAASRMLPYSNRRITDVWKRYGLKSCGNSGISAERKEDVEINILAIQRLVRPRAF